LTHITITSKLSEVSKTTTARAFSPDNHWPVCNTNSSAKNSSMTPGMIVEPSMNNRGADYMSPHISMAMKGDITKIDALVQPTTTNAASDEHDQSDRTKKESIKSRDNMGGSPAGSAKAELVEGTVKTGGYHSGPASARWHAVYPGKVAQDVGSSSLPQSRQTDAIFREPKAPASATSWSNVVSSNPPPSPLLRMTTRSSSGETLLTSNMSQLPTNFQHLGTVRTRSQSFDTASPPRHLGKSNSFGGYVDTNNYQQNSLGMPPSHPGHSSFKDSTLPVMSQGGGALHSPMMYPATPYQEFKARPSLGTYSPISLGESMTTDQTSPMSSPSISPHVSPAMVPRKQHGDGPPIWQLSDASEYHSEPSSPHHRLHSQLPQSIPEHHLHEPAHHGRHYLTPHHHAGPSSPTRHSHSLASGSYHHHPMYSRRTSPKSYGSGPASHTPLHHRSSTEVLKTLLRKKACLYEPETSLAISLVTWVVGRRLALFQGYFTRQQLQAGVHSCVAGKIKEGHVTRTKVNRCMQVILNSCFHYIIPRPDGSEECGEAFRVAFSREAPDEEGLLRTLRPPWNNLDFRSIVADEESQSSLFQDSDEDHHHHDSPSGRQQGGKDSSAASQAGDSLDSGKRSVLLCFNENVRAASDVFRCHNEFIRDVAHTGNLSLSPEDWQSFFSGTSAYRKLGAGTNADFQLGCSHLAGIHDRMDQRGLSTFRTSWCAKRYDHDHSFCAFAHVDVNRGWLRRDPFAYNYKPVMCPHVKPLQGAKDCYVNTCPHGVRCDHAHSREEIAYHPDSYKGQHCRNAPGSCPLGDICPNVHAETSSSSHPSLSSSYNRQSKRHYHDQSPYHRSSHTGSKRRASSNSGSHNTGFGKLPDGSPMLYMDPAPLSEFERTLALPGLQAMFRDHSSSIFFSTIEEGSPWEYGPFGYRTARGVRTGDSLFKGPVGRSTNL